MRRLLAAIVLMLPVAANAAPREADVAAYRALSAQDLRLATIGYRLVSANAPFCARKERNSGWVVHDIAQYPDAATANAAFGFARPIAVAAIVPDGPADRAHVEAGDAFIALGQKSIDWAKLPSGKSSYKRMAQFKPMVAAVWDAAVSPKLRLLRGDAEIDVSFTPPLVCASDFQVDTKDKVDAGADGKMVSVTSGLMAFAPDDQQLAAAVAHELAHNLLGHRERLKKGRRTASAVRATEVEADRLSMWLLANAGYDLDAALAFLERYGRKFDPKLGDGTHPGWKKRVAAMRKEMAAMSTATRQNGLLPPPLLATAQQQ